jgi:hypothetical protein
LVIPWALESIDGTISRLEVADAQGGNATNIVITSLTSTLAITALRNGAGNLLLIPWDIDATSGHVSRLYFGPSQGGSVASQDDGVANGYPPKPEGYTTAIAPLDPTLFVTAKVDKHLGLSLEAWRVDTEFGAVAWADWPVGVTADNLSIAPLGVTGSVRDFILAYRRLTYRLGVNGVVVDKELIVSLWRVSSDDRRFTPLAEVSGGAANSLNLSNVSVVVALDGRTTVLVSTDSADPLLQHMAFRVITGSSGCFALIQTGALHDRSYKNLGVTALTQWQPGKLAMALQSEAGLGIVVYDIYDMSATLVRPLGEAPDHPVIWGQIRAFSPTSTLVAVKNSTNGQLELSAWQLVSPSFTPMRLAHTASPQVPVQNSEVALAVFPQLSVAITAIRSPSGGRLRLDRWDISGDLNSITWRNQTGTAAGEADHITIVALEPDLAVTAVRNGSGNLLLIVWRVESDGTISRLKVENAQAGEVDAISLVAFDSENVLAAVRNGSGHLQIIGFHISSDGKVDRWVKDGKAGDISEVAVAALGDTRPYRHIVTAVRDGSDHLLVIAWRVSPEERTITRLTDSGDQAGEASNLSLCVVRSLPSSEPTIVTVMRRGSGNLETICWKLLDDPPAVPMLVRTGDSTNRADTKVQELTDCCELDAGRMGMLTAITAHDGTTRLWVSAVQVRDAVTPAAPSRILELPFQNQPLPQDPSWAKSHDAYPDKQSLEWLQVGDHNTEYDDAQLTGASGWVVAPEDSGGDVPFSHPFGFDWECQIALDEPFYDSLGRKIDFRKLLSDANAGAEEHDSSPNHNGIALADQLGLATPEGLLGLEWDKGLLPASYRGQVSHGDRIAVLGRWILDQGHDVDGLYRTEIHPPLLAATGAVVQPLDGSAPRTRIIFMSRPFLPGQLYTHNLGTRYVDDVDETGSLWSNMITEILKVITLPPQSRQLEAHAKVKQGPFRGAHSAQFVVRPPIPRPGPDAQLLVSYRFTVRTPCTVSITPKVDEADAVSVIIELLEQDSQGINFQPPELPTSHDDTYGVDDLDHLSEGAGMKILEGEAIATLATALSGAGTNTAYVAIVLARGIKTDVFDSLPDIDVLDPVGGVASVPVQQLAPNAGVVPDDVQYYPVSGWLEAYWQFPVQT